MITVVIPEFITKKRWHNLLHNQTSLRMKLYLIYQKNVNVCTIPFKLSTNRIDERLFTFHQSDF